ncbi:MAG: ATP-dependent zinc metalloprotease FtsH [Prolixibacteraceae bacterium]|nr:ATP-dependent zinc metalloprotease FtsH [Prolixibacteraceae bacterium]
MEERKKPTKSVIYYYITVFISMILLNALIFPLFTKKQITMVDYGSFIMKVDSGLVKAVNIQENEILFTLQNNNIEAVDSSLLKARKILMLHDRSNEDIIFSTVPMDDPGLVERLIHASSPNENGKIVFTKVLPKQNSPLLNFLLTWILPFVIFYGIGQIFIKRMQQSGMGGGNNFLTLGKSNAKIYVQAETGKTFADVAGQEEAKESLVEVIDFLNNPSKYTEIGASLPKGALLVGPPGTGKTLLAKAVAGEAKVPFFSITGSEFVEMFVGMGAAKVRDLFKQAKEKAPCIIFIDEIDTIGKKRDSGFVGGNDEREQTLNQLLSEMDGFDGTKAIVILAATNRPEILDKALLRPGRFDRRIPVELPDLKGREAILKVHSINKKLGSDINFNLIARATAGASGADLANMVNEAALRAVRLGRKEINQSDLEESVEVVLAGFQRKEKALSQKEKEVVAYHEIGHALVAAKQTDSAPVHKITIIPRTSGALGYTMQVDADEHYLMSKEEIFNKITTITGGRAAEEVVFNQVTTGASNDIEQATRLARAMVTRFGMSDNYDMMALETVTNQYLGGDASLICSAETAARIDAEVLSIIKDAHGKAARILKENRKLLDDLSKYLLDKETITGEEFMKIINE